MPNDWKGNMSKAFGIGVKKALDIFSGKNAPGRQGIAKAARQVLTEMEKASENTKKR